MKFQHKDAVIDAALFDGEYVGQPDTATPCRVVPKTCPDWFPAVLEETPPGGFNWGPGSISSVGDKIYIQTETALLTVKPGDWIIKGRSGHLHVMDGQRFAKEYEALA
ncbi:hypothetical protein [Brevundimonas sp. A19_0]|uniref:hypothetical protein n=1 Tax=Brevundimonas sp. A19_0 TaxID=2821087 RepID=UPI001ADD0EC4|nr:hypothetical protein [Brevundimonas sp. A19_0]MBO9502520.1 hypothetical protein [Brevundimonas sp. A19_0]